MSGEAEQRKLFVAVQRGVHWAVMALAALSVSGLGSSGVWREGCRSRLPRVHSAARVRIISNASLNGVGATSVTHLQASHSAIPFSRNAPVLSTLRRQLPSPTRKGSAIVCNSASNFSAGEGDEKKETLITLGFVLAWYGFNVFFNLLNKSIYKYLPLPWFVSAIHVIVGTMYCAVSYAVGAKKASFDRPVNQEELKFLAPGAIMHAVGHCLTNVSFFMVAISFTHTVKTLEPVFSVVMSNLVLGQATSVPVMLSLIPIMGGVALASAAEVSFNWMGFGTAMGSNFLFALRAVFSKKAMANITNLSSTGVYAYTTLISAFVCTALMFVFEPIGLIQASLAAAIAAQGQQKVIIDLLGVGVLYHLYNQVAFNTLERVAPVSHGVANVVKRVFIIVTSVLFFGNQVTPKTAIGTFVALAGVYLYTNLKGRESKAH